MLPKAATVLRSNARLRIEPSAAKKRSKKNAQFVPSRSGVLTNVCRHSAQSLLLFALIYVTWRFGGVSADTLLHVSWLLLGISVLTCVGMPGLGLKSRPMPWTLFVLVVGAIGLAALQTVPLDDEFAARLAPGHAELRRSIGEPTATATAAALVESFSDSADHLTTAEGQFRRPVASKLSIVPYLTKMAIAKWILMAAFLVLAGCLFRSSGEKTAFFWVMALNAVGLSVWGLIQRATGSLDLLPGVTYPVVVLPFATFIYKNAGAAALVPGLACVVGLCWSTWLPPFGDRPKTPDRVGFGSGNGYSKSPWWVQPKSLTLVLLLSLIGGGLAASLSRGAWMAVGVAILSLAIVARRYILWRQFVIGSTVAAVASAGLIGFFSFSEAVGERVDRLSATELAGDARWDHWAEGIRAAWKHQPLGSGLGTYGFASLAEQQKDSTFWFREAHNQYLETLTELGVPGVLLIVVGLALCLRFCWTLIHNGVSRQRAAVGAAGWFVVVAMAMQSTIDFVISIPAVLFLAAAVVGVVAQAALEPIDRPRLRTLNSKPESRYVVFTNVLSMPAVWIVLCGSALALAQRHYSDHIRVEKVLDETRIASNDYQPMASETEDCLAKLSSCLINQPTRDDVYLRRSHWNVIAFRTELMRASAAEGTPIEWSTTHPERLFQTLMAMPEVGRRQIIRQIQDTPAIARPLAQALGDAQCAILLNPCSPQTHLLVSFLSPVASVDQRPFGDAVTRLTHANSKLQFANGLVAFHIGDRERMVDQWHRCLRGTQDLKGLIGLAETKLSVQEIITKLIPENRTVLYLPLLDAMSKASVDQLRQSDALTQSLQDRVLADPSRDAGQRHALAASIASRLDKPDLAAQQWEEAVQANGTNAVYRYEYCRCLIEQGSYDEAIQQARLGTSLGGDPAAFHKIDEQARRMIIKASLPANALRSE